MTWIQIGVAFGFAAMVFLVWLERQNEARRRKRRDIEDLAAAEQQRVQVMLWDDVKRRAGR